MFQNPNCFVPGYEDFKTVKRMFQSLAESKQIVTYLQKYKITFCKGLIKIENKIYLFNRFLHCKVHYELEIQVLKQMFLFDNEK